ncbi:nucleotidyltransferase family protein [Kribbella ginsengisoli]|uniref:Nucleotidyltransferase family protein n=1 Tax=Kribbella ginsengisoli TaxID=363865 RepID=A0ABP6YD01_9ACTN
MLLAAGAGRRMGGPKALARCPDGITWVVRTARTLAAAGCSPVLVVVGAEAARVRRVLTGEPVVVVEATGWHEGVGASFRVGLTSLQGCAGPVAVAVVPVDTPGLTVSVVRRVAAAASEEVLRRAVYGGQPGHPIVLGRDHWAAAIASATGEIGARRYLKQNEVVEIECSGLAVGADVDQVQQLPPGHQPG